MVRTSMICEVYSMNKQSRKGQKVDSWHCQRFFNYIIAGKKPEYLGGKPLSFSKLQTNVIT